MPAESRILGHAGGAADGSQHAGAGDGVFGEGGGLAVIPGLSSPACEISYFSLPRLRGRVGRGHIARMTFTRITIDPAICTGKPCIRGMRFPVARLLGLLAAGETREQILGAYPYLEPGDIDEALRYAAFLAEDETVELTP